MTETSEYVQKMVQKAFYDPITELLLKKSNLTNAQFETLMIDILVDSMSDEKTSFKQKAFFRERKVSRGSFSRTLGQGRTRVISSVFTILLLSYVGVLQGAPFEEYQILAEKLREYLSAVESASSSQSKAMLRRVEEDLTAGINALSKPTSLKNM